MKIAVILIGYVLDIRPLVESIWSPEMRLFLFRHSNYPVAVEACEQILRSTPDVHYYDYGVNRGLGCSVNEGIIDARYAGCDAIVVLNDDLTMNRYDLRKLAQGCVDFPEAGLIFADERDGTPLMFHGFGINPIALSTVGYFDEQFPDYFADTDFLRRCELLGVPYYNIGETGIVHMGSGTLNTDPVARARIERTFPLDAMHYVRKHGSPPGGESFLFPFQNPELSWFISAEQRNDPYPAHRRPESEMIRG